ncbi:MAG: sugar phosphate isomerase/epimerase family protein [Candidatus Aerophobetes bacterium]|nr:sugar phosphate isomerase/epimerase family protein [Candidatus Aerophobetes bacterium]
MENEPMSIGVVVSGADPLVAMERVRSLGIPTCQMRVLPEIRWSENRIDLIRKAIQEKRVRITTLICGFKGESYRDIATIKRTVGLLNPSMREERVKKVLLFSDFAEKLGVKVLLSHIGFIPGDRGDPDYKGLVRAVQKIANYCKKNGQSFALETGQEPANALLRFIENVNRPNLGVNFDPANMLLYDIGNPIEALDILGKYVIGVHCKDGKRPERKGELGREYPLGEGDVGIEKFIDRLKEIGYTGPLTIEREIAGEKWIEDILRAKKLLEKLR